MGRRISTLAARFIGGFMILGLLICVVSTAAGYGQYKAYIQKQYNDVAYQAAEIAGGYLTTQELVHYVELLKGFREGEVTVETVQAEAQTARYLQIEGQLEQLRKAMAARDVYIVWLDEEELRRYQEGQQDWNPMLYLFDCYVDPSMKYTLGNMGGMNPEYREDAIYIVETGERSDNYFFSEGDFGYNTSAILPVVHDGSLLAVICVEIPMSSMQKALREYLVHSILLTVTLIALFIAAYMRYLYRQVIRPVNLMAAETARFIDNDNQLSERLKSIHTGDEIQKLGESILKMEKGINEYIDNLTAVTAEKERIGAELNIATQIQADMLPGIFPAFPEHQEFDIFASMLPAKEVGGDFYDFFLVDQDHLAVVIADVSGKGVPAALFMVIAKTLIKNHAQSGESLEQVFTEVNEQLCENNKEGMFVTAWMGILTISSGAFVSVNAGHNPPLLKRKNGGFAYLKCRPGFVLAGMEGICYRQDEMQLQPGDILYLYTDGVTEAVDDKERLYGEQRLEALLNSLGTYSPRRILGQVKADIDLFAGQMPQADDITMLCLQYGEKREDC